MRNQKLRDGQQLTQRPTARREEPEGSVSQVSREPALLYLGLTEGGAAGPVGVGGILSRLSLNLWLTSGPGSLLPDKAPSSHQRSQGPRCPVYTHLAAASGSRTCPASRVSLPSGQGDPHPPLFPVVLSDLQSSWDGGSPGVKMRTPGLLCGARHPSPVSGSEWEQVQATHLALDSAHLVSGGKGDIFWGGGRGFTV